MTLKLKVGDIVELKEDERVHSSLEVRAGERLKVAGLPTIELPEDYAPVYFASIKNAGVYELREDNAKLISRNGVEVFDPNKKYKAGDEVLSENGEELVIVEGECGNCFHFYGACREHGLEGCENAVGGCCCFKLKSEAKAEAPEQPKTESNPADHKDLSGKCPLQNILRFPNALEGLAGAMAYGGRKYGKSDTWKNGSVETYVGALLRHLTSMMNGELMDPESGLHHADHIMANAALINELMKQKGTEQ